MATIMKCANGHYYDADKTAECPYCKTKEEDKLKMEFWTEHKPTFQYQSSSMNEDVTQPMVAPGNKGGSVFLQNGKAHMQGISASDDQVTMALFSPHAGTGYVTGWLVCVEGPSKGRDYRILHGMNWAGRSPNMDIWISGDNEISRERHCAVTYDQKSNAFYITQGTGTLTYVNDELLEGTKTLTMGDQIKIGMSVLEFIPYCREGHVWTAEEK